MPRKPLRSQLNQVRAWVRQGRTDAWIAHQLDVPASELREFRRRHGLEADSTMPARWTSATRSRQRSRPRRSRRPRPRRKRTSPSPSPSPRSPTNPTSGPRKTARAIPARQQPRKRRRRRGGRGGKRPGAGLQASFDHGDADGYGLWLDPAVTDDPIYTEHWTERRKVEVTIEPDRIVIVPSSDD